MVSVRVGQVCAAAGAVNAASAASVTSILKFRMTSSDQFVQGYRLLRSARNSIVQLAALEGAGEQVIQRRAVSP